MTSLTDVYEGGVGTATNRRRRVLGTGLFVAGAAMVVGAIPIATTDVSSAFGLGVYEARELAGVLAGLGLPAVFVGIFAVLPAGRATRAAAAIGASTAVLGVAVFTTAYPDDWLGNDPAFAVATLVLYAAGTLLTFWCLFAAVATFNRRNAPGGTARLEITDEGTVRVVTPETGIPGLGGVGLFGSDPEGDVATQTNRTDGTDGTEESDDELLEAGASVSTSAPAATPAGTAADSAPPASDGAGAVPRGAGDSGGDPAAASADVREAVENRGRPDEYCGNCGHFEYVRAGDDIAPYCGFHADILDDMEACEQWESNR